MKPRGFESGRVAVRRLRASSISRNGFGWYINVKATLHSTIMGLVAALFVKCPLQASSIHPRVVRSNSGSFQYCSNVATTFEGFAALST